MVKKERKIQKSNKTIFSKLMFFYLVIFGLFGAVYAVDDYDYSKLTETLLNQDPDPAEPGDYVELRFKIEKEGNEELKNIEYELVPEYPFSFDGSDTAVKNLGDWIGTSDDKEYYTLYYKLKVDEDAIEGTYELSLFQTAVGTSAKKEIKFDIRVEDKKEPSLILGLIDTTPRKVVANYDEAKFEVEVVNNGDADAENIIVKLDLPDGFEESYGYSTISNLGTIAQGASKRAIFYLDTDENLKDGSYPTKINLEYTQDDEGDKKNYKIDLPMELKVFGKPEYEITNVEIEGNLTPGQKTKVKINVKNIGSKKAESTSAQVFKDSSQPFEFDDKTDYVGELEIGEEGDAVFSFEIEDDAVSKDYKLDIQIRSVVDGEVLVEEESVIISVVAKKQQSISLEYILGALIFIVGGIAYYVGKKQGDMK